MFLYEKYEKQYLVFILKELHGVPLGFVTIDSMLLYVTFSQHAEQDEM